MPSTSAKPQKRRPKTAAQESRLPERVVMGTSIVTALVTVLGLAPMMYRISSDMDQLKASTELAKVQTQREQGEINSKVAHFSVSWVLVDATRGDKDEEGILRDMYPNAEVRYIGNSLNEVIEKAASGGDMNPFLGSSSCSCPKVKKDLADASVRFSKSSWVYLLLTQDGGGVADSARLKVTTYGAEQLNFYTIDGDPLTGPGGKVSEVPLESVPSGQVTALGLFRVVYMNDSTNPPGYGFNISPAAVPEKVTFIDRQSGRTVEQEVREASNQPRMLSSGVEIRG